jgi:hypothetical protein
MENECYDVIDDIEEFIDDHGGYLGEHPYAKIADWKVQVSVGNTIMSYWDWAYHNFKKHLSD